MIKIVVDTNVLVSAFISKTGPPAKIFRALENKEIQLVLSESIETEYKKVLKYSHIKKLHNLSELEIEEVVERIERLSTVVHIRKKVRGVSSDPDDEKFLECAVNAEADYLISGDKHLLKLKKYQGIQILSPATFVIFLKSEDAA